VIVLLATNMQQGEHYMRRMFPDENPRGHGRNVRIATEDFHVQGLRGATFIAVGTWPGPTDKALRLRHAVITAGTPGFGILQGPRQ